MPRAGPCEQNDRCVRINRADLRQNRTAIDIRHLHVQDCHGRSLPAKDIDAFWAMIRREHMVPFPL